ncbi:MAG: DUF3500 domain-containing protein [Bacteroidia bacterium]|nr:DUF3500 domain-containing protein [Bacteroidia bacterium]
MVKRLLNLWFLLVFSLMSYHAVSQLTYNEEIKKSASAFIHSLSPEQKNTAVLTFDDSARMKWNNLPVGLRPRAGLNIGSMSDDQRKLLHRILSVSLSSQGYLKATSIMHLDNLLNWYYDTLYYKKTINDTVYERMKALKWSHRNFFLAFFGQPSDSIWGYKLEGHHLSINFTFVKNKLSVTPLFVGTDPAEYPNSEYAGWRVLGQEEDLGIKLIHMLSTTQQQKATMSKEVPKDIITAAESGKRLVDDWGIKGAEMNKQERDILQYIVREFVFNLEYEKALAEYDKIIKAGVDKIYFGWIGSYEEDKPHYYVLNGPTFLIEFDNVGFNGNANHIHAIWREKGNEYGEDVLRNHYMSEKH